MSWGAEKEKLTNEAEAIAKALKGKVIQGVSINIGYPGHFSGFEINFTDGGKLEVSSNASGCNECDPEGLGWGLDISTRE